MTASPNALDDVLDVLEGFEICKGEEYEDWYVICSRCNERLAPDSTMSSVVEICRKHVCRSGEQVFTVKRHYGSIGGCHGSASYKIEGESTSSPDGVSPEQIIGRHLGAGSQVRVTVYVIEEVPASEICGSNSDVHEGHKPGPDLIDKDGHRWTWSQPDGLGGTRTFEEDGPHYGPRYSAGYRCEDNGPDVRAMSRKMIEHRYGPVTEIAQEETK